VLWGSDWDPLFDRDVDGLLVKRLGEMVDGEFQKLVVESAPTFASKFSGTDPRLLKMSRISRMRRYARCGRAGTIREKSTLHINRPSITRVRHRHPRANDQGLWPGRKRRGEDITHQQKKLNEEELREFRSRFGIPSTRPVGNTPFYRPPEESREIQYLRARRRDLGGYVRPAKCGPVTHTHHTTIAPGSFR